MPKASKNKRKAPNNALKKQLAKDKKKAAKTKGKYGVLDSDEEPEPIVVDPNPVAAAVANPVANVSNSGPPPAISGPSNSNAGLSPADPMALIAVMHAQQAAMQAQQAKFNADMLAEIKQLLTDTSASSPSPTSASVANLATVTPQQSPQEEPIKDVLDKLNPFIKSDLFRHVKFIQTEHEMKKACTYLWKSLHEEHRWNRYNLDFDSFSKIYASAIKTKLSLCRQYSQSKSKAAAQGK